MSSVDIMTQAVGTGAALFAALTPTSAAMATAATSVQDEQTGKIICQADQLYDSNQWKEALAYLEQYADSSDVEVLWRLARLCYKVGKYHSSGPEQSQKLSVRGMTYAERALAADAYNFAAQKWTGILISWSSEFQGYKRKIERSYEIKDHFLKAIELNPRDPTCRHLLGQWCYSVAGVPWYQKKVAQMIFAVPPNSSFEEALSHFQEAEKIEPGFYPTNWLFIGKCHLQLGKVEEGSKWLIKIATHQSSVSDDIEAKEEAVALLRKLNIQY